VTSCKSKQEHAHNVWRLPLGLDQRLPPTHMLSQSQQLVGLSGLGKTVPSLLKAL